MLITRRQRFPLRFSLVNCSWLLSIFSLLLHIIEVFISDTAYLPNPISFQSFCGSCKSYCGFAGLQHIEDYLTDILNSCYIVVGSKKWFKWQIRYLFIYLFKVRDQGLFRFTRPPTLSTINSMIMLHNKKQIRIEISE